MAGDPIEHVVVLMLENHSFDEMLGCMKQVYPALEGVDPAHPATNPDYPSGPPVKQLPKTARTITDDPQHDLDNVLRQIGTATDPKSLCQGYVSDFAHKYPQSKAPERALVMGYYDLAGDAALDSLPVLHTLGRNFAVCDHWFSSMPGPTWPNRFFVHSGTCLGHVLMPSGIFHPNLHLYNETTIFDLLEARKVAWEIYFGDFPQTLVMTRLWPHLDHYHRMDEFMQKAGGDPAQFPQYCFIEPTYFGASQNDEHPPKDVWMGEALVATVYNAIRENEDLWKTTLLVVLYDEHGGFFDHVFPPPSVPPDGHTKEYSFAQYGPRVPALLISPWISKGVISTPFDHTSLLKYLVDKWNLGNAQLGRRTDAAATFAAELLKLSAPRTDTPAQLPVPAPAVTPISSAIPEQLSGHQEALIALSYYLESRLAEENVDSAQVIVDRFVKGAQSVAAHGEVAIERARRFMEYQSQALV